MDFTRRSHNQRQRVLELLQRKKQVSNLELNKVCLRYSSRIAELRNAGYLIRTIKVGDHGLYLFIYEGRTDT